MAAPLLAGLASRILGSAGIRAGAGQAAGSAARGSLSQQIALSGRRGLSITDILQARQQDGENISDLFKQFGKNLAKGTFGLGIFVIATNKIATALFKSREQFAQFDSRIAGVFAKFELAELRRTFATAQATSGSTEILGAAVNDLKDEFQPIRELGTNVANLVGTVFARVAQGITFIANKVLFLEEISDLLKDILNQGEDEQRPDVAAFQLLAGRPINKDVFKD